MHRIGRRVRLSQKKQMKKTILLALLLLGTSLGACCYGSNPVREKRRETRRELMDRMMSPGKFYITIGHPIFHTTMIRLYPMDYDEDIVDVGIGFMSLGGEYHYSRRSSVAAEFSMEGRLIDYPKTWLTNDCSFSLVHHTNFQRFVLGGGLNVSRNTVYADLDDGCSSDPVEFGFGDKVRSFWSYGLKIDCYYKFNTSTRIGFTYRPMLCRYGYGTGITMISRFAMELKFHINTGKRLRPRKK